METSCLTKLSNLESLAITDHSLPLEVLSRMTNLTFLDTLNILLNRMIFWLSRENFVLLSDKLQVNKTRGEPLSLACARPLLLSSPPPPMCVLSISIHSLSQKLIPPWNPIVSPWWNLWSQSHFSALTELTISVWSALCLAQVFAHRGISLFAWFSSFLPSDLKLRSFKCWSLWPIVLPLLLLRLVSLRCELGMVETSSRHAYLFHGHQFYLRCTLLSG